MFKEFSKIVANRAAENGIISSEYIDENIYGINNFLTILINVLTATMIGIAFNMLYEIAVFILVYKILRKYIGGSHEKTAIKCYVSSCILYIIILMVIKFYPFSELMTTFIMFGSGIIILFLAPVEAKNKPLDNIEKKVFKFRSRVYIIAVLSVFMMLHYIPNKYINYYSDVIAVSVMAVTVSAIEGKIRLKYLKKDKLS